VDASEFLVLRLLPHLVLLLHRIGRFADILPRLLKAALVANHHGALAVYIKILPESIVVLARSSRRRSFRARHPRHVGHIVANLTTGAGTCCRECLVALPFRLCQSPTPALHDGQHALALLANALP